MKSSWMIVPGLALSMLALVGATLVLAQSPATRPSDDPMDRLLGPDVQAPGQPLLPGDSQGKDQSSTLAPGAPAQRLLREGTILVDRVGRLVKNEGRWEFTFDADGQALRDPPVRVLENLKLMSMEDALSTAQRDLRFRITGTVTEYRGRNHVLIEKVVVVNDSVPPF